MQSSYYHKINEALANDAQHIEKKSSLLSTETKLELKDILEFKTHNEKEYESESIEREESEVYESRDETNEKKI